MFWFSVHNVCFACIIDKWVLHFFCLFYFCILYRMYTFHSSDDLYAHQFIRTVYTSIMGGIFFYMFADLLCRLALAVLPRLHVCKLLQSQSANFQKIQKVCRLECADLLQLQVCKLFKVSLQTFFKSLSTNVLNVCRLTFKVCRLTFKKFADLIIL